VSENSIRQTRTSGANKPLTLLHRLVGGFSATQILSTAAKLRIADHIGDNPRSSVELAKAAAADPEALHRFLRMLVALKLLTQKRNGFFGLSSLGQFLRSDHPQSVHERLIYVGEISYAVAAAMTHSVQSGKPAFDHVFGQRFFDYLAHRAELSAIFNRLMSESVSDRVNGCKRYEKTTAPAGEAYAPGLKRIGIQNCRRASTFAGMSRQSCRASGGVPGLRVAGDSAGRPASSTQWIRIGRSRACSVLSGEKSRDQPRSRSFMTA